jgi:hypothetical protein
MNDSNQVKRGKEAKAIVALVFRNGPIENLHAGKRCPVCRDKQEYSKISDREMKGVIQNAVNGIYRLLSLRDTDRAAYEAEIVFGLLYSAEWDDPLEQ